MDTNKIDIIKELFEKYKGKRKFTQSVEIAINFKGVNFSKQDNRLNISIILPNGRGKSAEVLVYADKKEIVDAANSAGAKVVGSKDLESLSHDKEGMKGLLGYLSLAEPKMMGQVAKSLGSYLGPKGKMPKPLIGGDVAGMINNITKSVSIITKGKFLPTLQCAVGSELMEPEKIAENVEAVLEGLAKVVNAQNVKSVYVKLSMSPPIKLI